jgi:hypothetical protein
MLWKTFRISFTAWVFLAMFGIGPLFDWLILVAAASLGFHILLTPID